MDHFFTYLFAILIFIVKVRIIMIIANYIGEQLGVAKFLEELWGKLKGNKYEA